MKKSIIYLFLICTLIYSCKKKDNTPEPSPSPSGNTSGPTADGFSALFSTQLIYSIFGTSTTTLSYANNMAIAANSDFTNFNFSTGLLLNMGTVNVNSVQFKNMSGYYLDSTYNFVAGPPYIWQCSGNAIPAFTYTNSNSYPSYSNYTLWPDTISKSAGLSLPLSGITNATEARIFLSVTGATSPANTATIILSTASGYSFNPSALSSLSTATTAAIQIDFYRNNIQTINGKKMNFRNVGTYIKTVPVKN